jgi:hypothetical protein
LAASQASPGAAYRQGLQLSAEAPYPAMMTHQQFRMMSKSRMTGPAEAMRP